MSERTPLLVLGLGNVLLEDDGVGAAAVSLLLERYKVPPGVQVLDGGTLGLSLLPYLNAADAVILIDAVRAEGPPGSLVRVEGNEVAPAVATRLSPHQVGVTDLLDGARWLGQYPRRLVLLGVVPESMDLILGLSSTVRHALPALVESIVEEASRLGFAFRRLPANDTPVSLGAIDVARLAGMRSRDRHNDVRSSH
jgi:hydrogenase maturation protease